MIFTNLAGTTSKRFSVSNDGKGQIVSNNTYDIWWNMVNGASGEKNHSVIFLNNGDDLNNAFTPAQYFKSNAEIIVANNPATSAFIMVVEPSSGDNAPGYVVQKIFTVYGEFFIRTRIDNTWQPWKKFAYTSDIPTMPALHAVATSGDYNSLINKPNIPNIEMGTWYANNNSNVALYNPNFFYTKFFGFVRLWGWFSAQGVPNTVVTISNLPFPVAIDTMGLASMPFVSDVNKAYSMIGAYSTVEAASNSLSFEGVLLPANDTFASNEPMYKIISNGVFFVMFDITYKLK